MSQITEEKLKDLKKHIPYKWRVQSFSKYNAECSCVAYIDARDAMNLLDEVVGVGNWQKDYKEVKGNLYAGVGIKINSEWVWQWDCGTESNTEKEKGEASDSFKRACVGFGIGRFLYDLPLFKVDASDKKTGSNYPYPVDGQGKKIKDLTKFINEKLGNNNLDFAIKVLEKVTSLDGLREAEKYILDKCPALKNNNEYQIVIKNTRQIWEKKEAEKLMNEAAQQSKKIA